jgi:hypothetical protein
MADRLIRSSSSFSLFPIRSLSIALMGGCALLLASCLVPATSEPESRGEETTNLAVALAIAPGAYTLTAGHSGKCVEVAGSSTADGALIQQRTCNGQKNQQWNLVDVGGGIWEVKNAVSGKCVDVSGWSTANGGKVHQWTCRGQANQRWRAVEPSAGKVQLRSVHSGKCVDVKGISTADGAAIQQWTCYNVGQQTFTLKAVGGTVPPVTPPGGYTWKKANLTWFTSYPDPGSEECIKYNGCTWAGYFAGVSGKQPESWVKANNIIAVHEKHFQQYKLKTFRITQAGRSIDAKVYDMCADSDCNGCCTKNLGSAGFLIDLEKYTKERFGSGSGTVDWTCLDCQ